MSTSRQREHRSLTHASLRRNRPESTPPPSGGGVYSHARRTEVRTLAGLWHEDSSSFGGQAVSIDKPLEEAFSLPAARTMRDVIDRDRV